MTMIVLVAVRTRMFRVFRQKRTIFIDKIGILVPCVPAMISKAATADAHNAAVSAAAAAAVAAIAAVVVSSDSIAVSFHFAFHV